MGQAQPELVPVSEAVENETALATRGFRFDTDSTDGRCLGLPCSTALPPRRLAPLQDKWTREFSMAENDQAALRAT